MGMRVALLLLAVLTAAGCAGPAAPAAPHARGPAPGIVADCEGASWMPNGTCVRVLDAPGGRDREASIATHPSDASKVLATWRVGEFRDGPQIAAAFSGDAGRTWAVTMLHNPEAEDLPMADEKHYAYDSIAGFGPDGTAHVMYGGDYRFLSTQGVYVFPEFRLTLASSKDGAAWTYHTFADVGGALFAPDYMDMAIAPDSGRITVVAQMFGFAPVGAAVGASEGIWSWSSDDGGATWEAPVLILANDPVGVASFHYLPRIEAGPGGVLVLSTNVSGPDFAGEVTVSRDGGRTWGQPAAIHAYGGQGTAINSPAALWQEDGQLRAALVYGDGDRLVGYTSSDLDSWDGPSEVAGYAAKTSHAWAKADSRGDGVWVETRYGSDHEFGAMLVRWDGQGAETLVLVEEPVPGAWVIGDDYAAIAVAADGSVWTAWSHPGKAERDERVMVAHAAWRA